MATPPRVRYRGELECEGCHDTQRITRLITAADWKAEEKAFISRHEDCVDHKTDEV